MLGGNVRRSPIVPHPRVAAIQAGPPPRVPVVLIARIDAPGIGHLDCGSVGCTIQCVVEDPIGRPTHTG